MTCKYSITRINVFTKPPCMSNIVFRIPLILRADSFRLVYVLKGNICGYKSSHSLVRCSSSILKWRTLNQNGALLHHKTFKAKFSSRNWSKSDRHGTLFFPEKQHEQQKTILCPQYFLNQSESG